MDKKQHPRQMLLITVILVYLVIALVMFFPIIMGIGSTAPGSGAFAYTNLWSFWWVDHAVFNGMDIFYTNMLFYPVGFDLSAQQLSLLTPMLFGPFGAVSTAFAYDMALFTGFMLSGIFMFLLASYITRSFYGSLIAGIVFEFSALHIAGAYTSMPLIFIAFIPLFVYFLIRAFNEHGYLGNALLMGASLVLASLMGNAYQALLLEVLFIFVFVAYLAHDIRHNCIQPKRYGAVLASLVVAAIIASIVYLPLLSTAANINEEQAMSTSIESFFLPSYYNGLAHNAVLGMPVYSQLTEYRSTYIGYAVLLLAVTGAYATRKKVSTKLLLLLAFFSGWLALGPAVTLNGSGHGLGGLYVLYSFVPYFNALHEPVYFDLLTTLALGVLSAYGIDVLVRKINKRSSAIIIVAIISFAVLAENNGMPLGAAEQSAFLTHVAVPSAYKTISATHGNFSVLALPSISTPSNSTSALYASEASFYTSIMGKPLVGGYSENENLTDLESVYNIPLAIQATNLAYFNEFSYSSPVVQNYTEQTLLTLYNYGTAVIVINKSAYNQSSITGLVGYMINVFGEPVYNGASNIAFETASAINASIYKSFVAYPALNDWLPLSMLINATQVQLWVPEARTSSGLYGEITVYAPYANATGLAHEGRTYAAQLISAQVGFDAYSAKQGSVEIGELNGNSTVILGAFNTTATLHHYALNTTFGSGPYGNVLFFITQQSNPAYIYNITFYKR